MDTTENTAVVVSPSVEPTVSEPTQQKEIISPRDDKQKAHDSLRESLQAHLKGDKQKVSNSPIRESLRKNLNPESVKPTETQVVAPKPEPIAPPADMSAEDKKFFEAASPELQKYISRRAHETQSNYTRKTMEVAEREKALAAKEQKLSAFEETLSPVREEYAKKGISEVDLVRRAIAWDQAFARNPVAAAKEYLDAWGIDPSELNGIESAPKQVEQAQQYLAPEDVQKLVREQLEQERRFESEKTTSARNANAVQEFIKSVPLFSDPGTAAQLEAAMDPIVQGLVASNPGREPAEILKEAYNYIAKGHPVFSELVQKYEAKNQSERTKQAAIKAQSASRSVSGGPGSGSPHVKFDNIRDNLRARLNGSI